MIRTLWNASFLTNCNAVNVLPKRILAFQSILSFFLKTFCVCSTAASCSGRRVIIGSATQDSSIATLRQFLPSLTALIAAFAVSKSVLNHSVPSKFSACLIPERFNMLWTS